MVDLVLLHLQLEAAIAPPTRVLPPIVCEHLFRRVILGGRTPVHFDYILRRLAPEKLKPRYVTRIIVDIADQKCVPASKTKREDVRLPELVRC